MKKKLEKALDTFIRHFAYAPELLRNTDFDQEAYADELMKCVTDDLLEF